MKLQSVLLASSLFFGLSGTAQSQENKAATGWVWGAGILIEETPYIGYDNRTLPIPIIGYNGEKFSFAGTTANYQLYKKGGLSMSLRLGAMVNGYDEDDSEIFTGMDDRDFSLALGGEITYVNQNWTLQLTSGHDILDRSGGYELNSSVSYNFELENFSIKPFVGARFQDSSYVDYYYGVSAEEATDLRNEYIGDSAVNSELGLTISTNKYLGGVFGLTIQNTWYDDSISDSPLTDTDSALSMRFRYTRFF